MGQRGRFCLLLALGACGSSGTGANGDATAAAGTGGAAGTPDAAGAGGALGAGGATAAGGAGGASRPPPRNVDLCAGLVSDKAARPMTALSKPAAGATVTDAEFGTTIRRITAVAASGSNPAIRPLYSTVAAWNADESLLLLYNVNRGHELYDGKTYEPLRPLDDISPADLEQVYWHTSDPDVLFYVDRKDFIRYHVVAARKETLATFSFCTGNASGGSDPMFMSFDSARIGLGCGDQSFIYDVPTNTVIARQTYAENPAQISPSGTLGWLGDSGRVTDASLAVVRTLDLAEPYGHSSLGIWPTGEDTWNGVVYDDGPAGNTDIGSLVTFDMTTGKSKVVIGPKTGYPYPPTTHLSGLAYLNPGWVVVSTFGDTSGKGLLDLEITIANTVTGAVCRAGRHRSWGKSNTKLAESYWAEAHAVPSPSGTRVLFASDWGNGATVDAYVLELPSYQP
ncbi:MAG: hypothetical protein JXP73_13925 [Deltaproteobacteria bacterium]|nr:hypothetical protein [Deltaproteobacteria bacterium]